MHIAANVVVGIVALIHIYILVLEMFMWESETGLRTFNITPDFAAATREMAANQGLYNGFLAAGLFWSLYIGDIHVQRFFLGCVLVAGVYGALTVNARILLVQAAPAVAGLLLLWLAPPVLNLSY
jgi:putative membrane protein